MASGNPGGNTESRISDKLQELVNELEQMAAERSNIAAPHKTKTPKVKAETESSTATADRANAIAQIREQYREKQDLLTQKLAKAKRLDSTEQLPALRKLEPLANEIKGIEDKFAKEFPGEHLYKCDPRTCAHCLPIFDVSPDTVSQLQVIANDVTRMTKDAGANATSGGSGKAPAGAKGHGSNH